jgi:hypothetical protein
MLHLWHIPFRIQTDKCAVQDIIYILKIPMHFNPILSEQADLYVTNS